MKKFAIFVLSSKGGPGKTTWARSYLDVARTAGLTVAAYDCDGGVGQLIQYYGSRDANGALLKDQDAMSGVATFDVRQERERDEIVNALPAAKAAKADILLFDLPGGAVQELKRIFGSTETLFEAVRRNGYEPVVVVVITPALKSAQNVKVIVNEFGSQVGKYVVVKNLAFSSGETFKHYDAPRADDAGNPVPSEGKRTLHDAGGVEIVMPRLEPDAYWDLDAKSLGFTDAVRKKLVSYADELRIDEFITKQKEQFVKAGLLPKAAIAGEERVAVHAGHDETP